MATLVSGLIYKGLWSQFAVSQEAINGINWYLVDTNSGKLKLFLIIFGGGG